MSYSVFERKSSLSTLGSPHLHVRWILSSRYRRKMMLENWLHEEFKLSRRKHRYKVQWDQFMKSI